MKLGKILSISIFFILLSVVINIFNVKTTMADSCPSGCFWHTGANKCTGSGGCWWVDANGNRTPPGVPTELKCDPCITDNPDCPSIPNQGSVYPRASSCDSSNCGGSCGVYTFKCGTLCYEDSCGASACNEDYPSCTECTLPQCPLPLSGIDTGYPLENFVSCNNTNCSVPVTYGNCYEVSSNPPNILVTRISDGSTSLGYNHIGFTGKELNNPYSYRVRVTDSNGQQDIEAFYIWFTNAGAPTTPEIYTDITGGNPYSYSDTSFGIMYRKDGNNWIPYNADYRSSPTVWRKSAVGSLSSSTIFNSAGTVVGRVDGAVSSILNGYDFTLDINPSSGSDSLLEGNYNIYAQANDVFSFTPYDNYPELELLDPAIYRNIRDYFAPYTIRVSNNWQDTGIDWVVDLTNPVIESITSQARGSSYPSEVQLDLHLSDNLDVSKVVLNVFGSRELAIENVRYNGYSFTPDVIETTSYIGLIGHAKSFSLDYPGILLAPDTQNSSIYINIGDNRGGTLYFVATLFDSSGNTIQQQTDINLEDWVITQGNFVYSENGLDFDSKSLAPGLWNSVAELANFQSDQADISTELYSDMLGIHRSKLINYDRNNSYYISNLNTQSGVNNYSDLLANLQNRVSRIPNIQDVPLGATLSGNLCAGNCATNFYYLHTEGDLTVNSFVCNGKGIITVGGDLIINPDITNSSSNRDACVFLVHGTVNITSGAYHSASSLRYDQVNAFIISYGVITLESDSGVVGSRRDGLKINGSLISFNSQPINVLRFLSLGDKQYYPSVVLEAHEKYGAVVKLAFGSRIEIMKTQVGFKPF